MGFEIIKNRTSIRSFRNEIPNNNKILELEKFIIDNEKTLFKTVVNTRLIKTDKISKKDRNKFFSNLILKGNFHFIAGKVVNSERSLIDYGYLLEKYLLKAEKMGFGTIWLHKINNERFEEEFIEFEPKVVPAAIAIGEKSENKSISEKIFSITKTNKRYNQNKLFFEGEFFIPIFDDNEIFDYFKPLEAVRLAPSWKNNQPWRVVKVRGRNIYHFFINEVYSDLKKNVKYKLKDIDIGIALCHFEEVAKECGLKGKWTTNIEHNYKEEMRYVASWIGED